MRTTVTLDADTEALLREEASRTGESFKSVLNRTVKRALGQKGRKLVVKPLFGAPFPAELKGANFNRLADEWDDEETSRELSR